MPEPDGAQPGVGGAGASGGASLADIVRLLRPHQWVKSAFVLLGPAYGLRDLDGPWQPVLLQALLACAVFALASSGCYIFNDLGDVERDRAHPRKRNRPIASGRVSPALAIGLMAACWAGAVGLAMLLAPGGRWLTLGIVAVYAVNVILYSRLFKHAVIADVISLALGFVLRVLAGCAAAEIVPSTWLLNCTFFLAMFLAFGKRLGERRTAASAGYDAAAARGVQTKYTDDLLRMSVVVTAVATLLTYAGYVQAREAEFTFEVVAGLGQLNWMWITLIPATYCLLRSMVLIERGVYDDPTEMAVHDRPLQVAGGVFLAVSGAVIVLGMRQGA